MQLLQTELDVEYPELGIQIIGVNAIGHESDNADMCEGRDLPWLQDTVELNVWDDVWGVATAMSTSWTLRMFCSPSTT